MPAVALVAESIEGERSVIRCHRQRSDEGAEGAVVGLYVDTIDPTMPGYARRFDLSQLCSTAAARSPRTLQQTVDPALSEDARLDALKCLVLRICQVPPGDIQGTEVVPQGNDPRQRGDSASGALECVVRRVLCTSLEELFEGVQSRSLRVLRGHKPIVEFIVTEREAQLQGARMRIIPVGCEVPLLDDKGFAVDDDSLSRAIDDFFDIVRHCPDPSIAQVVELLAREYDIRRFKGQGRTIRPLGVHLRSQIGTLRRNSERDEAHNSLTPEHFEFDSRATWGSRRIEDGRMLWIGLRQPRWTGDVTSVVLHGWVGRSIPFRVTVECPSWLGLSAQQLRALFLEGEMTPGGGLSVPRLAREPIDSVKYEIASDPRLYPETVNSFVRHKRKLFGDSAMGLGLLVGRDPLQTVPVKEMIEEFTRVGARYPVWGSVSSKDVLSRWSFQGFVDENMQGRLFVSNPMGARISLQFEQPRGVGEAASNSTLEEALEVLFAEPERFWDYIEQLPSGCCRNMTAPYVGEDLGSPVLAEVANMLWEQVEERYLFGRALLSRFVPWRVIPLLDGRSAIVVARPDMCGREATPLFVLVMGVSGIEEFLVSLGERSALGMLRGTLFIPQDAMTFDDSEMEEIVRFICCSIAGNEAGVLKKSVKDLIPLATQIDAVSMALFDPQREEKDLVLRALNWIRRLFT